MGHAIQYSYSDAYDRVALFEIIYSFHMPLFMFISGIVDYREDREIDIIWLKKRAVNLLAPFAAWIVIPFMIKGNWNELPRHLLSVLQKPDNANWFLLVLFLNCALLLIAVKCSKLLRISQSIWISLVIFLILVFTNRFVAQSFGIGLVRTQYPFFVMGYYIYCKSLLNVDSD